LSLPPRWSAWIDAAVVEEEQELEEAIAPRRGRPLDIAVAAVALVVVVTASVAMERGASVLGRRHHVAEILVGGLVLAAVTSLPNAVAAVYLAAKGRGAATWSTALNSNTLNVVVGLLIPGAILGLARPTAPGNLIAAWCLGLTVLTVILAYAGRGLRRWAGTVVILAYAGFVAALLALA
jgi:cation:H+ antiporter